MRVLVLVLASLVSVASAQTDPPNDPPRSSRHFALSAGAAPYGTAVRLLAGNDFRLSDHSSIGLVSRISGAREPYSSAEDASETNHAYYVEGGLGLRPVWRPTDRFQAAVSAGVAVAAIGTDDDDAFLPIGDIGFTLPIEVDGSVRMWRGVGVTASASRSAALSSAITSSETVAAPEGYALDHWTATVGIRVGGW